MTVRNVKEIAKIIIHEELSPDNAVPLSSSCSDF